jgi:hypothetical protein
MMKPNGKKKPDGQRREPHTISNSRNIGGGEDTENREKLVDRGSNSDHRCGDCCGHAAKIVDGGLMVSVHFSLKESFLLLLGWHTPGFSDLCVRLVFMRLSRLPPVKVL